MTNKIFDDVHLVSTDSKENQVLKSFNPLEDYGEVIYKLICNDYYIYKNQSIMDLSNELEKLDNIFAVGVVDEERKVVGIIIKEELSLMLSKMYGRDVFMHKKVSGIMKKTKIFFDQASILQTADELKEELKLIENHYYITVNAYNQFTGVFSTKSILIYLSEITRKDLMLARKIQQSIVREELNISTDKINLTAITKMASDVGGDFYAVKKIEKQKWIVIICDVSGKGINASLLSCIIGGIFNAYDFKKGLFNFIKILNDYIIKTFKQEKFITGIIMEYDEESKQLNVFDLGHSFLYIFRGKNIFRLKQYQNNLPIGITKTFEPKCVKIKLKPDDLLIIFTDGLTEQKNNHGKVFSENNLKRILIDNIGCNTALIKEKILYAFNEFKGNYRQVDDLTFVLLK